MSDGTISYIAFTYEEPDQVPGITQAYVVGFNAGDGQRFFTTPSVDSAFLFRVDGELAHM